MKTIAELKAELKRCSNAGHWIFHNDGTIDALEWDCGYCHSCIRRKARIKDRQSILSEIQTQVGKCENKIHEHDTTGSIIGFKYCRHVPEPQKCPGCRALLKFEKEM